MLAQVTNCVAPLTRTATTTGSVKWGVQSLYQIRLVYEMCPSGNAWADVDMPDVTKEEMVQVEADSQEQAARRAMLYNKIAAKGRLVRYSDDLDNGIYTF